MGLSKKNGAAPFILNLQVNLNLQNLNMSRGVSDKITYKPYNQDEQWLLPPSLGELVPKNHFVRIVSKTVDELEIEEVFARNTKGGGASRYNPVMLLKVLIYCYMTGTYSSRQIAKQCRENVNVMWLTGFQKPDFRTINTFRSEKLKDSIEEIFVSTVKLLNRKNAHAPVEIQFLTKRQ